MSSSVYYDVQRRTGESCEISCLFILLLSQWNLGFLRILRLDSLTWDGVLGSVSISLKYAKLAKMYPGVSVI